MGKRENNRQPFVPTDKDRELVGYLAAGGIPHEWISKAIQNPNTGRPISEPTLRAKFPDELSDGGWKAKGELVSTAFAAAKAGSVPILIYLLKVRMGWRESVDVNAHHSYAELVEAATKPKPETGPLALGIIKGGKA